ncbi:MAG: hypothetical protein CMO34_00010 [Verrucomicrobia bacterium]|nr:hypothetical protein [Verrucomicrobiota bacterium]
MEATVLIARILAIVYLSFGIGMLLNKDYYQKTLIQFIENSFVLVYGGYMAIVFGMIILSVHNSWLGKWTDIITLIGWVATVKGIWLLAFPKSALLYRKLFENKKFSLIMIPIVLALGILFGYFGFLLSS